MAMSTWLQMVSADEVKALETTPTSINKLDKPTYFRTHFFASLNYFLTGDSYPSDHALAPMLGGSRYIDTSTLECGNFGIVDISEIPDLLSALSSVDRSAIQTAIESADYEALLDEQECYEFEVFEAQEIPECFMSDFDALVEFYKQVAAAGHAVVCYTT